MSNNEVNYSTQIESRICELQKSYIQLQEEFKQNVHGFERALDNSALNIIDILDIIDAGIADLDASQDHDGNAVLRLVINKIKTRLNEMLRLWQVQEIIFVNNRIETGKARVLETQQTMNNLPPGSIIKICRKGYYRGLKVIRAADVITAL